MSNFNQLQAKRRSIYALGKELPVSNDALVEIVEKARGSVELKEEA